VTLTNVGNAPVVGRTNVLLLARTTDAITGASSDVELTTTPMRPVRLRPGQSRVVPVKFNHLDAGGYMIVARVDPTNTVQEGNEFNNEANTGGPFQTSEPLARPEGLSIGPPQGGTLRIGRRTVIPVAVRNTGNIPYSGVMNFDLFATPGPGGSGTTVRLAETFSRRIRLRHGQRRIVRLSVPIDASLPPGEYSLSAGIREAPATGDFPTLSDGTRYPAA
jgi:hypothetical protein